MIMKTRQRVFYRLIDGDGQMVTRLLADGTTRHLRTTLPQSCRHRHKKR